MRHPRHVIDDVAHEIGRERAERRREIATRLLAGILANQKLLENLGETITPAKWAVYQADALLEELES